MVQGVTVAHCACTLPACPQHGEGRVRPSPWSIPVDSIPGESRPVARGARDSRPWRAGGRSWADAAVIRCSCPWHTGCGSRGCVTDHRDGLTRQGHLYCIGVAGPPAADGTTRGAAPPMPAAQLPSRVQGTQFTVSPTWIWPASRTSPQTPPRHMRAIFARRP